MPRHAAISTRQAVRCGVEMGPGPREWTWRFVAQLMVTCHLPKPWSHAEMESCGSRWGRRVNLVATGAPRWNEMEVQERHIAAAGRRDNDCACEEGRYALHECERTLRLKLGSRRRCGYTVSSWLKYVHGGGFSSVSNILISSLLSTIEQAERYNPQKQQFLPTPALVAVREH